MQKLELYYRNNIVLPYAPGVWNYDHIGKPVEHLTVEIPDNFIIDEDEYSVVEVIAPGNKVCDIYRKSQNLFMLMWKEKMHLCTGRFVEVAVKKRDWVKVKSDKE